MWKCTSVISTFCHNSPAFLSQEPYLWSFDLLYIGKFSMREINLALPFSRFFLLLVSRNLSFSLPLILTFKFIRSSSRCSFSSSVRTSLDVCNSWSSSRDEDHDFRDAEVELAEKKCGARAGSFFCLLHLHSVFLFLIRSPDTFSQVPFLFKCYIRKSSN